MSSQLLEAVNLRDFESIKIKLASDLTQEKSLDANCVQVFDALLKLDNTDVLTLSCQYIAELGKKEENRKVLARQEVVRPLLQIISGVNSNRNIAYQAYRALGNLCFENDEARKIVDKNGLETVVRSIKGCLNAERDDKILTVACGCLLNILMSNDELQKASISFGVIETLEGVIRKCIVDFERFEDCLTHVFFTLSAVSDHLVDEWFSEGLCYLLVDTMRISNNPEVSTLCLELLRMQADNSKFICGATSVGVESYVGC